MDIDTATRVWFENLRSMTDALDHLLAEKDALIASQARRIRELEEGLKPFALASSEGVVKAETGLVQIVTCAEYFHRARSLLSRKGGE